MSMVHITAMLARMQQNSRKVNGEHTKKHRITFLQLLWEAWFTITWYVVQDCRPHDVKLCASVLYGVSFIWQSLSPNSFKNLILWKHKKIFRFMNVSLQSTSYLWVIFRARLFGFHSTISFDEHDIGLTVTIDGELSTIKKAGIVWHLYSYAIVE